MVKNLDRLARKLLKTIPAKTKRELRSQMAVAADKIVASAEGLVPQADGDLFASIGWVWGTDIPSGAVAFGTVKGGDPDLIITVFAGSDDTLVYNKSGGAFQNARLQEFGTQEMEANPFFFPAYRLNKRATKRRIKKAVKKAIISGAR